MVATAVLLEDNENEKEDDFEDMRARLVLIPSEVKSLEASAAAAAATAAFISFCTVINLVRLLEQRLKYLKK